MAKEAFLISIKLGQFLEQFQFLIMLSYPRQFPKMGIGKVKLFYLKFKNKQLFQIGLMGFLALSLKNKASFQIGLMDCPRVAGV